MRLILETWWYISIFLHFSTLSWCRLLKSFLVESKDPFILFWSPPLLLSFDSFHFSGHHPVGVRLPHLPVIVSVLQQCGSQWIARPASYNRWGSSAWPMKWFTLLYPQLKRIWKGGILVSPCPSVHLWTELCPLCIQQYLSDPFYICTSYQATWEGVSSVMFVSKFKKLKFWRIL